MQPDDLGVNGPRQGESCQDDDTCLRFDESVAPYERERVHFDVQKPLASQTSVDTTHDFTRADAHFFRAHITVHNSHIDPHFPDVGTPHWLKVKGISAVYFFFSFSSLSCFC